MNSTTNTPRQKSPMPLLVLDRFEAAEVLHIGLSKLDTFIRRGELAVVRLDGRVLIQWSDLKNFIARKRNPRQEVVGS